MFARACDPVWFAVDGALLIAGIVIVARGWRSEGPRSITALRLALAIAVAVGCVLLSQLAIHDGNLISADESNYLATLRAGAIQNHGVFPFNLRWLEPVLAGLHVFPVRGADALKAVNFGAMVVTAAWLVLLLVRLRVPFALALQRPCS